MSERPSWDVFFIGLAEYYSKRSKDPSTKVGAVIVRPDDNSVAGLGYNGFPRDMPDSSELLSDREEKYERIIHGEINALGNCRDASVRGYTLYTIPFQTCHRCFVQCANRGITRFVAPKPTPEILSRWEKSILRTWKYADEMGFIILNNLDSKIIEMVKRENQHSK